MKSLNVPIEIESPDNMQNDLLLFYTQLVFFDIAKTLKAQTWAGNYGFECCACDEKSPISPRFFNRHCMPIEIPEKDPVFRGKKCMNFIRAAVTHDNCQLKEASIVNFIFKLFVTPVDCPFFIAQRCHHVLGHGFPVRS